MNFSKDAAVSYEHHFGRDSSGWEVNIQGKSISYFYCLKRPWDGRNKPYTVIHRFTNKRSVYL
ncbi:MAG: hypothetical protein K0R78_1655 [Pelosinus sp.]|jgi:hypothetical protein|nr:hypothetical protein [Pelosinus sp.]